MMRKSAGLKEFGSVDGTYSRNRMAAPIALLEFRL